MAKVERILAQLQEEAAVRGASWLQDTVGTVLQCPEPLSGTRGHRSRPPERYSPDRHAGPQRRAGGSDAGTLSGLVAKRAAVVARGSPVRSYGQHRGSLQAQQQGPMVAARPTRRRVSVSVDPAPRRMSQESGHPAQRAMAAVPGPSNTAAGDRGRLNRGRRSGLAHGRAEAGGTEESYTGPSKAVQKSAKGYAAWRQGRMSAAPAATRAVSSGELSSEDEVGLELRSPGELSGSEKEAGPLAGSVMLEENGRSAVQPGKTFINTYCGRVW